MRPVGVFLVAVALAGCGTTPPSPAASIASTPSHETGAPQSASPAAASPKPTPEPPKTISDLIADPLPSVTLADVGEPADVDWARACQVALPRSSGTERLAIRETDCLLMVAREWPPYAQHYQGEASGLVKPNPAIFDRARAAYAFAVAQIGPSGRQFLDSTLRSTMPAADAVQVPGSPPSGLRTWAALLKSSATVHVNPQTLAGVFRDAVAAEPLAFPPQWSLLMQMPLSNGGSALDSFTEVCAHGYKGAFDVSNVGSKVYDLDSQDACENLMTGIWRVYLQTGSASAWDAALLAYRVGIQGSLPCDRLHIAGNGCPAEWLDGLRLDFR